MTPTRVLLLAPSRGLGGGIERYVSTIETALHNRGIACRRLDVSAYDSPLSTKRKVRFLFAARAAMRSAFGPTRVVLAHWNLLPVVALVRRYPAYAGSVTILHGSEVWSAASIRQRLIRLPDVKAIAVSNFTAGAMVEMARASVLEPGMSSEWFDTLVHQAPNSRRSPEIVTVFRLSDWRSKGLPTLLQALKLLNSPDVRLTVCGSGQVPDDLAEVIKSEPRCTLVANAPDRELARRMASAYAVVLATRTRPGVASSGEGFGMVLTEAQVAGVPVIAPAYGGSGDAYQPGLTGLSPKDESAEALAVQLGRLLSDHELRDRMAQAAADWARRRFDPVAYADRVIDVLLG